MSKPHHVEHRASLASRAEHLHENATTGGSRVAGRRGLLIAAAHVSPVIRFDAGVARADVLPSLLADVIRAISSDVRHARHTTAARVLTCATCRSPAADARAHAASSVSNVTRHLRRETAER